MGLIDRRRIEIGKYRFTNYIGKTWVMLFSHDIREHLEFWTDRNEAYNLYDKEKPWKYSILNEAMSWEHPGEKYEFILEFLETNKRVHWQQNKYPLNESGSEAEGFNDFKPEETSRKYWNGLGQCSVRCALVCGLNIENFWYYALGTIPNCGDFGETDFPGADSHTKFARLWMNVNPIKVTGFATRNNCKRSPKNHLLFVVLLTSYN